MMSYHRCWCIVLFVSLAGCQSTGNQSHSTYGYGSGYLEEVLPESLAELVEHSPVIVVVRHLSSVDFGPVSISTPLPSNVPGGFVKLVVTNVSVEEVLRSDGVVTVTEPISYSHVGRMPLGATALAADADSDFPFVWNANTEFVLFLDKAAGSDRYHITFGACARILTGGSEVSCSDGGRTVLDFMSGVDRDDFLDDIGAEIDNPSDTATPPPTMTPDP